LSQIENEEVSLKLLHTGVGDVTESDITLAAATRPTVVLGFQVGADNAAKRLAADEKVEIRLYQIIYDLLDDVRNTILGMLEIKYEEVVVGEAQVRALFQSSRLGTIAGCYVLNGVMTRNGSARVRRGSNVVWEGRFASLRRIADDVTEVSQGFECGIVLNGFNDFEVNDIIECVEQREQRRSVL
jgi:translation initiation factor IF-2